MDLDSYNLRKLRKIKSKPNNNRDKKNTTKKFVCHIIGDKRQLKRNVLPTIEDVLKHYLWLDKIKNPFDMIVANILEIWHLSSIQTVSKDRIMYILKYNVKKYKSLLKNSKKSYHEKRANIFKNNIKKLFDISACKCIKICICKCKCSEYEMMFLLDQRSTRKMTITTVLSKKNGRFINFCNILKGANR